MKKNLGLTLIIIFIIMACNTIYSRYVLYKESNIDIKSSSFYFSAELDNSELNFENSNINIVLKNNDNQDFNKYDIEYEIILENDKFTFNVDGEQVNNNKIIKTLNGGNFLNETLEIEFAPKKNNTFENEEDIILQIKTIAPYKKEINLPITITHDYYGVIYVDENKDKAIVPPEFTISKAEEENVIENGLVVYLINDKTQNQIDNIDWSNKTTLNNLQKSYDQFVWIPVENPAVENKTQLNNLLAEGKYPMAIQQEGTDANGLKNYRGILYNFELSTDGKDVDITPIEYSSTGYREPAYLTDSTDGDKNSTYNNVGITEKLLQEQFNLMVNKVKKNLGFYIGRYETSNMSTDNSKDSTNQVKVIKGTQTGINEISFYRMYAQQKNYSKLRFGNNTKITSNMIWGSQWDQALIFIKNIKNESQKTFYILNSIGMANHSSDLGGTGTIQNTGYYSVQNIYDLAGNVAERTLEAYDTDTRVFRGGSHVTNSSKNTNPVYRNISYTPRKTGDNCGTRLSIY